MNSHSLYALNSLTSIGNLAVDEAYRRRGIATKLIKVAEKIVEKWGDKYLFAGVDCTNEGAIAMYLRLGYKVVLDERDLINRTARGIPRLFIMKTIAS
jgi:ribosomal protein S18 acetylase RimI-like enzyme